MLGKRKRATPALLDKVEKWNRWADRWEDIDLGTRDPYLNYSSMIPIVGTFNSLELLRSF